MTIDAKLEVTLKFSTLPNARPAGQGKMAFALKIPDGQFVTVAVNNKAWGKLVKAAKEWPPWVVALSGTMGERTEKGFMRVNPGLQVFECKLKAPADAPASIAFSRAGDGHHRRGHGDADSACSPKLETERLSLRPAPRGGGQFRWPVGSDTLWRVRSGNWPLQRAERFRMGDAR